MKLDSPTLILVAGVAAFYLWRRRQPIDTQSATVGTPGRADPGAKRPTLDASAGVQLGTAADLGHAYQMATADLRSRFGVVQSWQESHTSDGRATTFTLYHLRGGTADYDATYTYSWQPADGAVRRLS